ncbi:FmdB family zinc ribbon protein [Sphaerotilaceae bacterium SBD11-9]
MPIYAYRCEACGHAKDVLQKISDPVLTDCPSCGAPAFKKQVTAAGFQLKGSGWYVTDFRGGAQTQGAAAGTDSAKTDTPAAAPASAPAAAPAASATPASPAPAAAPSSSGGTSSSGGQ